MAYKQLQNFYPNDMGKEKGYCLKNVAMGYHIYPSPNPSSSAKQDMERNIEKDTLHRDQNFPTNCAVPVYLDTASQYEHILVCDKGTFWSDGRKLSNLSGYTVYGWGEWCNGYKIVEYEPEPQTGFLPPKGYWCRYDKDERVAALAQFMRNTFPAYTPSAALGPIYGDNIWRSIKEFQRRTGLEQDGNTGPKTYNKLKEYGFNY